MSPALALFDLLCEAANAVDALRASCLPGGEAWCALTEIVQALDGLIDRVVCSNGFEEDGEPVGP
jgi:hypothetical protein